MNAPKTLRAALLFLAAPALLSAAAPPSFRVLRSVSVPGDGGWDYLSLDPAGRRLYLAHADSVQVLDARDLRLLGTVAEVRRPHGIVALPAFGRGYASSGDPGSVVVFDLKTLAKVGEIRTAPDCDGIVYEPATRRVFTFNGDSADATAVDPKALTVTATLALGGQPEAAVADGRGDLFDDLADKDQVVEIDAKAMKITRRWSTAPGAHPTGIALDARHGRLFVGCRNGLLVVMDSATGRVLQTLPIGAHIDTTAFDPKSGLVFDSCGDGTLSVVREGRAGRYAVLEDAATVEGARTMALDPARGVVYTDAAETLAGAPAPAGERPNRRRVVPGTFRVLELGR